MLIKFKDPETFRDLEIDTDKFDRIFEQDHAERRPTKEHPGGYAPSVAFKEQSRHFNELRKKHTEHLKNKLKDPDPEKKITQNDILAARTLEILAVKTNFDPKGQTGKGWIRDITNGKKGLTSGSKPTWVVMQKRATDSGKLEGSSYKDPISFKFQPA